ncbi:MAG TPA: cellulose synthase family protein [Terriglobia bacterium]|nr:cellulose synthase family protein [Terriglobia bacterium]
MLMTLILPPDRTRFYQFDHWNALYHLTSFDIFILIPYLAILTILAFYGIHRYHLVFLYLKNKHKTAVPPGTFDTLPKVTVQLPIYNEMYVVERLVEAACRIRYPKNLLEIQILDDSTDGTQEIAAECAARLKSEGFDIHHIHRPNRMGFKAGALENGMKTATGKFIAIFDADFIPAPNFLEDVIHHFTDSKVGMVQVRWGHINREYSLLTQVESMVLDGHFVIEHAGRHLSGRFFNFNGTAGIWRRETIETAGGWEHDTLTEDTDLSYRAQMIGWNFLYLPHIVCPAELPVEMNAFKTQQFRWAKGLIQTGMKLLPRILRSKLPLKIKVEAFFHLTANISYPLMIVLSLLMLPAMIVRFNQGWFQMLYIDLPLWLAATASVSTFYLVAQRELYPNWRARLRYLPFLMAVGIGLSVSNSKAVIEALLGIKTSFKRTPKYRIESKSDLWTSKKYLGRTGILPIVEILLGLYFALVVYYAFSNQNYPTIPFLMLFVVGFIYMGLMSVLHVTLHRWLRGL